MIYDCADIPGNGGKICRKPLQLVVQTRLTSRHAAHICQNSKTAMAIMKDFVVNVEMVTIGGGDSDQDTNH